MRSMFQESRFNQPIGTWNTASVNTMYEMFGTNTVFAQDLNDWDTSKVTNMVKMFNGAAFNQDISKWNIANTEIRKTEDEATQSAGGGIH